MVAIKASKRSPASASVEQAGRSARAAASAVESGGAARRTRKVYDAAFKLKVVEQALKLPASNRIKPTCRMYPGVEPVCAPPHARIAPHIPSHVPEPTCLPGCLSRILSPHCARDYTEY